MYFIGSKQIKNICIVGAGNIGHYMIALLGENPGIEIKLLTSNANGFQKEIESTNIKNGEVTVGRLTKASSKPEEVIPDADMIIFTLPSHIYKSYLDLIYPIVSEGTILGFIPGTGGVEFLTKDFIKKKKCPIFGSQRVPSGTKVIVRGAKVNSLGNRKDIRFAAIPGKITGDICNFFSDLMGIETLALPNYLSVTFTPSNPILHTSRLYGLFHDYTEGMEWDSHLAFYKNWDVLSSEILIGCNDELQKCCEKLRDFDLKGVVSLIDHYEICSADGENDIEKMTNKIRSLPYLKDYAPMCRTESGKFKPDLTTRYFHEDFPYGLCIVKDFCDVCDVKTPYIDRVLKWYDSLFDSKYYNDNEFGGEGLRKLPLPKNYEIYKTQDVTDFYANLDAQF